MVKFEFDITALPLINEIDLYKKGGVKNIFKHHFFSSNIGKQYKDAKTMWKRVKKGKEVMDAFDNNDNEKLAQLMQNIKYQGF